MNSSMLVVRPSHYGHDVDTILTDLTVNVAFIARAVATSLSDLFCAAVCFPFFGALPIGSITPVTSTL
jgi:hypothetical protein